jgi:hypothetical protein
MTQANHNGFISVNMNDRASGGMTAGLLSLGGTRAERDDDVVTSAA